MGKRGSSWVLAWVLIVAAGAWLSTARGAEPTSLRQGSEAERARSRVSKYKAYLDRSPYHERSFDGLVEAAVAVNELRPLVEGYEARLERDGSDLAARVVLARLLARTEQDERALELLRDVEEPSFGHALLVGSLHLARNEAAEGLARLDAALELATRREELEEVHRRRGAALLALGNREEAAAAFHELAEIDPQSLELRLSAAEALADSGLSNEALAEFAEAERLAGEDVARRCRVLGEMGRLHETLIEMPRALELYEQAIALMGRGNWLKRDLSARVLSIHQRSGTLEELVERTAALLEADRQDLDARERGARALEQLDRREEARELLSSGTEQFPEDLTLSRHLIEVLRDLEDTDGVIAEYQRLLGERPQEFELYIELGRLFASEGRLDQARRQWGRTLEQRLSDPALCVRLATLYALYDMVEDAAGMFEKALTLEPREMRHYADFAAFLAVRERAEEIAPLLERAAAVSAGDASRLEELATLWSEYGEPDRARDALERALELRPEDARLTRLFADALIEAGEIERATELLHVVVEKADRPALRKSSIDRIVRLFRTGERLEELAALEQATIAAGGSELAPHLVLGRVFVQLREPDRALPVYEALLELDPANELAREELARLHEERGEFDLALKQFEALLEKRPQGRREYLKEIARIHLALYDQERAFECYEEILRSAPDNPAAFREVAEAYDQLGLHDRRVECLEQAVRLKPDDGRIRLELAAALKHTGDWDRAREHVLFAIGSDEREVREDARKEDYLLLSETGKLTEEIESLRERIEDNPYDAEAPLALTDVYVRELEYELALELLDRLISFQPREQRLLRERARLNSAMERHEEAISDFEALWKLPDTDHESLALRIGEEAMQMGDLERAENVLAGVADLREVARLYSRNDLPDESIAAVQKGITRNPGDANLWRRLARLHEKIGERESAVLDLERVLAIEGDRWRTLEKLGRLLHELGRKEEAVDCGQRLFAAIRVAPPEDAEDDDDQDGAQNRTIYFGSYRPSLLGSPRYTKRVGELRQYFGDLGADEEFVEIASAEMALQPTSQPLLQQLLGVMKELEERGEEARALLRELRAVAAETGRSPTNQTRIQWEDYLAGSEIAVYDEEPALAEARVEELLERVETGAAGELEEIELVQLLKVLRRDAQALEHLRAAGKRLPDSARLAAGLASELETAKDWQGAATEFSRAIERLEARPAVQRELEEADQAEREEIAFRRALSGLRQGFPLHLQRRVRDEDARRLHRITRRSTPRKSWGIGQRPQIDGLRFALARCLLELERIEEAGAVFEQLAPRHVEDVWRRASIARMYFDHERYEEAEAIYLELRELEESLERDPLLAFNRRWSSWFSDPMKKLARIRELGGEALPAYDLLRDYGSTGACELLLSSNDAYGQVESALHERIAAAEDGDFDQTAWRNAKIKLAELYQFQNRWDEVQRVYESIAERLEEDFQVRKTLAALHLRAGRPEQAVALHYEMLEKKRELNRRPYRPETPTGRRLTPIPPGGAASTEDYVFRRLRNTYGRRKARFDLRDDYVEILKLHLDRRRITEAADVLRQIARDDASAMRWLGYSMRQLMKKYELGREGVPILRMVWANNPDDDYTGLELGKALFEAGELDEAERLFQRIGGHSTGSTYYRDRAEEYLERIRARRGVDQRVTLAELEASVVAEPKNVKQRLALARLQFKEREFADALENALVAESLAPHLDEVRGLVSDCLQVLGRDEELELRLRDRLPRAKDEEERFLLAVRLANWMHARGETEEVEAFLREHVDIYTKGSGQYSASSWFLMQGDLETGERLLAEEIELSGKNSWNLEGSESRLDALQLLRGDPLAALDRAWKGYEKSSSLPERAAVLGRMAGVLRRARSLEAMREVVFAAASEHGGARGALYEIAWLLGAAHLDEAEEKIDQLVQADAEQRYLVPTLVTLARERGDIQAAHDYLERLEREYPPPDSQSTSTSIGSVSERNALRAERGSLLFALGREDEAHAVWAEMFDEDDEDAWVVMPKLYELHGLHAEALGLRRKKLEKTGERSHAALIAIAEGERELGNGAEALRLLERALILTRGNPGARRSVRGKLLEAHRAAGSIELLYEQLQTQAAADPADSGLLRELARVALELGRVEEAVEQFEELATRPDAAKQALTFLDALHREYGHSERGLELARRMAVEPRLADSDRRPFARSLAGYRLELGEDEEARALMEEAWSGADSLELLRELRRLYRPHERWEALLETLDESIRLEPDDPRLERERIEVLRELDRHEEAWESALALLEGLDRDRRHLDSCDSLTILADELDGDARLRERLVADPEDVEARLALACIARGRRDWAAAVAELEALLQVDPDSRIARSLLWPCYQRLGRIEDMRALIPGLIEELDREQDVVSDGWSSRSRLSGLLGALRQSYLETAELDALRASFDDPPGERYATLQPYYYTYYNSPFNQRSSRMDWYRRRELYDEFLAIEGPVSLLVGWDPKRHQAQVLEVRHLTGAGAAVIEEAWALTVDRADGIVAEVSGPVYFFPGNEPGVDELGRFLVNAAAEEDRLDELLVRIEAEREQRKDGSLDALYGVALSRGLRWKELAELQREGVEEKPADTGLRLTLARTLRKAESFEESLVEFEEVLARKRAAVPSTSQETWTTGGTKKAPGKVRFSFGGKGGSSGTTWYSSSSSSSSSRSQSALRLELMALYAKVGREQEARELEEIEMASRWEGQRMGSAPETAIAMAYAKLELADRAERWYLAAVENDPKTESIAWPALVGLFGETGDQAKHAEYARLELARLDEQVAEEPYSSSAWQRRARFQWREMKDLEAARQDALRADELSLNGTAQLVVLGWVDLESGRVGAALETFTKARERMRLVGRAPDADLLYGLGLARAEIEGVEAARTDLRRALAKMPDHDAAERARERLQ